MSDPSPTLDSATRGLSAIEAARRLKTDGPNALPAPSRRNVWRILLEVMREPMLALLLGGGVVYLLIGDPIEALILLAFATFSVSLTVIQEIRTEHVLEALRDLSAPRAAVIRDGRVGRIAGREVVRGDLLVLDAGDRIAADAIVIEADHLEVDESLLTGESLPVPKSAAARGAGHLPAPPGRDVGPWVYSGSIVVRGRALASVTGTGVDTEIGRIGTSLRSLDPEVPRLKRETARIVRYTALAGATIALMVVALYGFTRGDWLKAALAGITTAMTLLPEEFPVVLAVFMAMGAWRIGQVNVLARRAAAIETLGETTVLCADKTGTLTENRMVLARLWTPLDGEGVFHGGQELPVSYARLIECSVLATPSDPTDPMEIAIIDATPDRGASSRGQRSLTKAHGFRRDLLVMANEWRGGDAATPSQIFLKGAPEAIAGLCRLDADALEDLRSAVEAMAREGTRVLGVAAGRNENPTATVLEDACFAMVGLIGFADPLRPAVPAAIRRCREAGIRVVMITGDHPETARAVADAAGLDGSEVLTGIEVERLDAAMLGERLRSVNVFARILPEQKLRIVQAFKGEGDIVAMTGDGVNDAPSLKAAHIGIAMGGRGTDVAREAAAIVLLDDNFASIVEAIALGRRIYDNIRKAVAFIVAVHVPIAGMTLMPLLLGQPLLFGPIHIAMLEMVIDPVCALVFEAEPEEEDLMRRKPRDPAQPLISRALILWTTFQGGFVLIVLAGLNLVSIEFGLPEGQWRALMFLSLVAATLALILVNRSYSASLRPALSANNRALGIVAAAVGSAAFAIAVARPVQAILRFETMSGAIYLSAIGVGVFALVALELIKLARFAGRRRL